METYIIYYFIDENQKPFYIGVTKNFKQRIRNHKYEAVHNKRNLPKYYKVRKLLKLGLTFENIMIPQEINLTKEQAFYREIQLIKEFKEKNHKLYNLTTGGEGFGEITEETRKKLKKARTGQKRSEESKKRMSEARKGMKFSDKHKENLSKARRKRITTEETKQRMSKASKGKINIKTYKLIDPDENEYITTNGLVLFCKEHNLTSQNLHKVLNGQREHHKGWKIENVK